MERAQRENSNRAACPINVAQFVSDTGRDRNRAGSAMDNSPFMVAQHRKLQNMFGAAVQLGETGGVVKQGTFVSVQCVEEEEPLQGKFSAAQLEAKTAEGPLRGKHGVVQRVTENGEAQTKSVSENPIAAAHLPLVAQRVWKTMGPGELKWDRVMGGLQWFFHREDDCFSYLIVNDTDVPTEVLSIVETHEGKHLTEKQLDRLGFAEIDFVEGDDRVQYEAPEPRFAPVDVSMVTKVNEKELVERLSKHLAYQTMTVNYDRLSYINAFLIFMEHNPLLSLDEALANFDIHAPTLLKNMGGGHCGGLSGSLLQEVCYGSGAYLVASKLPREYQQKGAPEYCHVAAMIRFQSPDDGMDNGLILLEPGFNITIPIVIKKGMVTSLDQGEEIWDFSLNKDLTEVICQPKPKVSTVKWKQKQSEDKKMTYRTDVFLNPDMSLTVPLLRMDGRPQILGRDEKGNVVAVIAINYAKERIEFRVGTTRYDPIPFKQVDIGGKFLGEAAAPLAELLHMSAETLVERLYQAVTKWKPQKV